MTADASVDAVLQVDTPSDGVRRIRLHRPAVLNALNLRLRLALAEAFTAADGDPAVRAVVLAGGEKAFCAGADLHEYRDATPAEIAAREMGRLWDAIAQCRKPVVAAVRGHALGGGCELAMHADVIVAGDTARFGQPEVLIGLMPGGGATQRLPRLVGTQQAMRLMLTGQPVGAAEALAMGLVAEVVPDAEVDARALALAATWAAGPAGALAAIKDAVVNGLNLPLQQGLAYERRAFALRFDDPDKAEGIGARLQKRPARFGMPAALPQHDAVLPALRALGPQPDRAAVLALYAPLVEAARARPGGQADDGVRRHDDLAYGDDPRHRLDVYAPAHDTPSPPRPVVLLLPGGGFIGGDKRALDGLARVLAADGLVVAVANYRLAPIARWPSGPQDAVRALHWLRDAAPRWGGDAQRLVIAGESAGGAHVAAAVLMRRFGLQAGRDFRAAALLSGPYDCALEGMSREAFGIPTPDPRNDAYVGADPAGWAAASIVDQVDASPFPLLIAHAERDLPGMTAQAGALHATLVKRHGFRPEWLTVPDHDHFSQTIAAAAGDRRLADPLRAFVRRHA